MSNINDFIIEDGVLVKYTGYDVDVVIPDAVTSLGEACFKGCTSLKSAAISSSVSYLGKACFGDCHSLESVTIPPSVTYFGECCFAGCKKLTIYAEKDSAAAEYAEKNGIKLEII